MKTITRGFLTIATGDEHYYRLAANLLLSYRLHCGTPFPFAILADRENHFTDLFDKTVLLSSAHGSYRDKLEMLAHPPFDENIFIDADCLAYGDLNFLWSQFPHEGGFSAWGCISDSEGWFDMQKASVFYPVTHNINLHGGVYFFANDNKTNQLYHTAEYICQHYTEFGFHCFATPADEPILALAMAVHNFSPLPWPTGKFAFLPHCHVMHSNVLTGRLILKNDEGGGIKSDCILLHFRTDNTRQHLYQAEAARLSKGNSPVTFLLGGLCTIYHLWMRRWDLLTWSLRRRIKQLFT